MRYYVKINNVEYEVEVDQGKVGVISTREASQANVGSTAASAPASAEPKAQPEAVQSAPVAVGDGEAIKAPMPGAILDVRVNEGEAVKRGQVILILEAMKMENEIVAPADGKIIQIRAARGASVNAGDVLAVLSL
jgi:biotin carboxyl carrier protein